MHVIPATKDAIIAALGARSALNSVPKLYAQPTEPDDFQWAAIWLGEELVYDSDWSQVGAQRRRIKFRVPFTIVAITESDDARATDAACWSYFEEFETALRASPSFAGLIQQFDMVTSKNRVVPTGPKTWEATIIGMVVCTSRPY